MWSRLLSIASSQISKCSYTQSSMSLRIFQKQFLFPSNDVSININRNTSFFNKLPADHLWKSVVSVSNAGAKKGRGKGIRKIKTKDLNRGQIIGVGKANIVWPGLSSPIIKGNELVKQQQLPEDTERQAKLIKLRDSLKGFRRLKLKPFERGWTGSKVPGRKLGPPDPIGDDKFEGFETICLEFRSLNSMSGTLGRVRKISALSITGNSKGLFGFALGKAKDGQTALRKSRNRAGQKLIHIELFNNHTVFHDFFTQFGKTKIFVWKKSEGYGLECHRAIKSMCQIIGIKDLHAKIEGPTNMKHIVKAFIIGLLTQKNHQQIAEDKKLNLVEFRKENDYFPKVMAIPSVVRTAKEIPSSEILDFTQYSFRGKVVLKKAKRPPFYTRMSHWRRYLKSYEKRRNHDKIKMDMLIEHGKLKSFLTDQFPETKVSQSS